MSTKTAAKEATPARPKVLAIPTSYKPTAGAFGILNRSGDKIVGVAWEGCRDRFQESSQADAVADFVFSHSDGAGEHVVEFIRVVEELVHVQPENRLQFSGTSLPTVLHIQFTPWWKYRVRRSLLTALLRAGQYYTERTPEAFEKALYSQYYLSETKVAVSTFLAGRTASRLKRRDGFYGWHQAFAHKKKADVRRTLVKLRPKTDGTDE